MPAKKKSAKRSSSAKSSTELKDMKPNKDAKAGAKRYDVVGAFPKKLE